MTPVVLPGATQLILLLTYANEVQRRIEKPLSSLQLDYRPILLCGWSIWSVVAEKRNRSRPLQPLDRWCSIRKVVSSDE